MAEKKLVLFEPVGWIRGRSNNLKPTSARDFRLADLPADVLQVVIDHLDWPIIYNIRLACRSFAKAITKTNLQRLYDKCRLETAFKEKAQSPPIPPGITTTTTTTHDKAMIAALPLPCYRCLQWFSRKNMDQSKFSYGMISKNEPNGTPRRSTFSRVCFDCGVKNGTFVKGSRWKGQVICRRCGNLGRAREPFHWAQWLTPREKPREDEAPRRFSQYCDTCQSKGHVPDTFAEHVHGLEWFCRYQKTMWHKWEKTKAKRRELGVHVGDEGNRWTRWCSVLEREAVCNCDDFLATRINWLKLHKWTW